MATCAHCKTQETELYAGGVPICLDCANPTKPTEADRAIRSILTREVVEATANANAASLQFHKVTDDIPSALPHPDGTQRIQNAARQLSIGQRKLMTAHNRLSVFLSDGVVPEDLKQR